MNLLQWLLLIGIITLNLFELIWDEKQKHFNHLKNEPKIWSSSTLYTEESKEIRQNWFKNWVSENEFESSTILEFHHSEIGNKEQSILMKRSFVETVSITSIKKENENIELFYEDVIHKKNYKICI